MRTRLCEVFEIEFPIFAFTHCRDVVAAVSQAGGFGVLGALAFPPEQLEIELRWIDEHVGGKPYGVDIVVPNRYVGQGEQDIAKLEGQLRAMIPQRHREFAAQLLAEHGVPELVTGDRPRELLGWTAATAAPQLETALKHDGVRLIANALGTPPADMIQEIKRSGRLVSALCGSTHQALRHKEAGVDIIIAQGYEAGGHTGEVASMVLWPEVIAAVAPTPVLAAGGIGSGQQVAAALALGAEGVWTGSIWLTVEEAAASPEEKETYFKASSRDTVRSRSFTGKPARMLRNAWTDAWEGPDAPETLGLPLQFMVAADAVARALRYPTKSRDIAFSPVGQIVGTMSQVRSSREMIQTLVEEYLDAVERLQSLLPSG